MVKNFKLLILAIGTFVTVQAQDSTKTATVMDSVKVVAKVDSVPPNPATTFSGSLDLYYRYNFSNPPKGVTNNFTSFTNSQNSFELGMATVRADHTWSKGGVAVELGFGRRAQEFSYNEAANPNLFSVTNIVQAYVFYNISDRIKLTMGKWGTHIGYEVVDAAANRNYSMSYMFSYGPFYNTGLKADIAIAGKTAIMVGVSNPTDNSSTMDVRKMFIAQLSTATPNSKWKFYLNYQGGSVAPTDPSTSASLNQSDLVVNGTITDKFGIGFNATDQMIKSGGPGYDSTGTFWGAALYLNLDPSPVFGLTFRGEYFDNNDGIAVAPLISGKYMEYTLTGQIHLGKLTVMPELRLDTYSPPSNSLLSGGVFENSDGTFSKSTFTGLLAATYVF
jgi:Putative beta-barrel porin-2, OmpL-like. bbp2